MDNQTPTAPESQSPAPVVNSPEQPKKPQGRNWKKWILIYLAVGAIIYVGAYYFATSEQPSNQYSKNSPQPTKNLCALMECAGECKNNQCLPPKDPTADWKTYANTKYGFSFKYHDEYTFEKEDAEKATFSGKYVNQIIPSELIIYFQHVTNLLSLKNCTEAPFSPTIKSSCISGAIETFTVHGVQFRKAHVSTGTSTSQASSSYITQTIDKPYIELFRNVLGGGYEQSIDKILQTFKFTDQKDQELEVVTSQAKAALAEKLRIDRSKITVVSAKKIKWSDGSIGCPEPGKMYTQSFVDGYEVILQYDQNNYNYHAGSIGSPFLCEK